MPKTYVSTLTLSVAILLFASSSLMGQIKFDPNVPADQKAVIAVNIDIQALYKNKLFKSLMDMADAQDDQSPVKITDITKISALVSAPKGIDPGSLMQTDVYLYVGFKDPATVASFRQMVMDMGGETVTVGGKTLVDPDDSLFGPEFLLDFQNKYMVAGTKNYLASSSNQFASKNLAAAYASMAKAPIRIVIDFDGARDVLDQASALANENANFLMKPYISLIDEVSAIKISSDLDKGSLLKLAVSGHDAEQAAKITEKLNALIGIGKGFAEAVPAGGPEKMMMDAVADIQAKTVGNDAVIDIKKPEGFEKMVADGMAAAQGAARAMSDVNNVRQVVLAMHNYHDTYRGFPFAQHCEGEDAGKGLSWAVHFLPFLEQSVLFDSFDTKGDFNSAQNAPLAKVKIPSLSLNSGGKISFIRASKIPKTFADITDGSSNTAVFVQNRATDMSPWTKPTSITPKAVIEQFKALKDGEAMIFGMYDGAVHKISNQNDLADIEAMLEPADGKAPKNLQPNFEEFPGGDDALPVGPAKEDAKKEDFDPFK